MCVVVWTIYLTIIAIFLMLCVNSSSCIVLKFICEEVLLWNLVTCWSTCVCHQHHSTSYGFLSCTHCLKHSALIWFCSVRLLSDCQDLICVIRPQTLNCFPCLWRLRSVTYYSQLATICKILREFCVIKIELNILFYLLTTSENKYHQSGGSILKECQK
jgi:hypothetical protein